MTIHAREFAVVDEMGAIIICEPSLYSILDWLITYAPTFYCVMVRDYGSQEWEMYDDAY